MMIPLSDSKEQRTELRIELHKASRKGHLHRYRVLLALVLLGERQLRFNGESYIEFLKQLIESKDIYPDTGGG